MIEIRRYVTRAGKDLIGDGWQVWMPVCERKLLRGLTDFLLETSAIANLCARECPNFGSTGGRDMNLLRDVGQNLRPATVRRR